MRRLVLFLIVLFSYCFALANQKEDLNNIAGCYQASFIVAKKRGPDDPLNVSIQKGCLKDSRTFKAKYGKQVLCDIKSTETGAFDCHT